jgi:hypothetical protein
MDCMEPYLSINEENPQALDTVITTAVVTAAVVPFVQGLISRAAEDSYQAVRNVLRRRFAAARGREPDPGSRPVLVIKDGDVALFIRPELDDDAIVKLADIPGSLPAGRLQIYWNEAERRWQIDER